MTLAAWAMAALFALSAAVQWNDPDPWLWIAVYGASAVASGLAALERLPRSLAVTLLVVCLGGTSR
jgi:hypothetical protein